MTIVKQKEDPISPPSLSFLKLVHRPAYPQCLVCKEAFEGRSESRLLILVVSGLDLLPLLLSLLAMLALRRVGAGRGRRQLLGDLLLCSCRIDSGLAWIARLLQPISTVFGLPALSSRPRGVGPPRGFRPGWRAGRRDDRRLGCWTSLGCFVGFLVARLFLLVVV